MKKSLVVLLTMSTSLAIAAVAFAMVAHNGADQNSTLLPGYEAAKMFLSGVFLVTGSQLMRSYSAQNKDAAANAIDPASTLATGMQENKTRA